ncbi:hypothetical protein HZD82_26190, partial [Pantoea agglomerans]|nr:hypothetical protein [Pantoea agglomerans]
EEARAQVRGGKGGKHRKPSALQQGFNKPAQAVNRDVVIGESGLSSHSRQPVMLPAG